MFSLRITAGLAGIFLLAACNTPTTTGAISARHADTAYTAPSAAPIFIARGNAMPVGAETPPPFGFVGFCQRHPSDCVGSSARPASLSLTDSRWSQLQNINAEVNRTVTPIEDADLYNTPEWWAYPAASGGDCEDFVLLKKRMLIESGWPADALLISVVKEPNGAGHAVLLVVTSEGEYVLDNKTRHIRVWQETPYTWVKRQSRHHPYVWVRTGNGRGGKSAALDPPNLMMPIAEPTSTATLLRPAFAS
jgi:predicted transglutaminase-like cysteine proteinase